MLARVLCIVILALEFRGLSISLPRSKWKTFIFYTQLSNLVTAISAGCLVILGQLPWITGLRYLSTCMLIMTFLVTTCVLIPMGGNPQTLLWSGNGLYHHVLCPVISTIAYLFFEKHAAKSLLWLPVVITLIYGVIMLALNGLQKVDGPYPFFRVRNQSPLATVLWIIVLLAAIAGISAIVLAVAN